MSALSIQVPFPVFQDRDGQPLDNGYVWLGTSSLNPQTNPVVAYYDSALTIVATQPLRTLNGFISRAGSPAQVYVDAVNFSILVQDRQGTTVFSVPEGTGISPNASGVVYDPAGTGAVATTVQTALREFASIRGYGGVIDGSTADTAAIALMTATGKPFVNSSKAAYEYGTIAGGYGNVNAQDTATIGSSEMVTNGTFSSAASGWTLSNFTAAAGITKTAGTTGSATRSVTLKPYRQYLLTAVVVCSTKGGVDFQFAGSTMIDDSGFYAFDVSTNTYQFNFINGTSTTANIGIVTDTLFAGSITSISLIEVSQEMPLTYNNVSADDLTLRIPQGLKFGRFNAGVLGFGDRQTLAFTQSAGTWNVAVGARALSTVQTGLENTAVGSFALRYTTTSFNTAVGYSALKYNTVGAQNTGLGYKSLTANTVGVRNSAGGYHSLFQNTSGNDNTAFGWQALYSALTNNGNSAFGSQTAMNCRGASNAFFGALAGFLNVDVNLTYTYNYGTSIGAESKVYGNDGTAVGFQATVGTDPNSGGTAVDFSTSVGSLSEVSVAEGVALGYNAKATTGGRNIAIGKDSLASGNSAGDGQATAVGFLSQAVGYGATSIGSQAGKNYTGQFNTFVGYAAGGVSGSVLTYLNVTCLGAASAATANNQITLGDTNIVTLRCQTTTITAISDQRDKEQIAPLDVPDEFLDEVLVASWIWNQRDLDGRGESVRNGSRDLGVIAQQLQALQKKHSVEWLKLVDESNPERLEATPGKLLFLLIQKVQRQSALIASIEARLTALEAA